MRLSTIFISSAFVLAGTSTAFRAERGNMLMARSADSDFISEVYGRAYDEDHKLYAGAGSRNNYNTVSRRRRRSLYEPPRHVLARRNELHLRPPPSPEPQNKRESAPHNLVPDPKHEEDTPHSPISIHVTNHDVEISQKSGSTSKGG